MDCCRMDPALKEAAKMNDVNFLRKAVSQHPHDAAEYFLCRTRKDKQGFVGGNIFHLIIKYNSKEFFREAMKLLPIDVQKSLLLQIDEDYDWIPLHAVAYRGEGGHDASMLMIELYKSLLVSTDGATAGIVVKPKPWLELSSESMTPLHMALKFDEDDNNEKCAMELLSMDDDLQSCTMVDCDGNSPLYYALKNGYNQVAEKILMSPISSNSFTTKDVLTPFHLITNSSSENVSRLLLKNHLDCIDMTDNRGFSALHEWAESGEAQPCKLLLESTDLAEARTKIFKQLVISTENEIANTPLHLASKKKSEFGQILIRGYQQELNMDIEHGVSVGCPPWKIQNNEGDTPLHIALDKRIKHEELALEILLLDPTLCHIRNNFGESPFLLAVLAGCECAVEEILRIDDKPRFDMLRRNDGITVLHCLSSMSEKTGRMLLEKFWWMINLADDYKKTALDYAKDANVSWLVSLLMNPSRIQKEKFDWIEACKREDTQALLAFIDSCNDLPRVCREANDTPLHHIKLNTHKDLLNFLQISSIGELKNTTDHDGATPLYRALERKDMLLAKVLLLDDRVERMIVDHNGTTAMDLLTQLCKENNDWDKMCKQIKVNPYLKTTYIQLGTNLEQMRNTLSVVAALLATITFAAGFTLPGGLNSDTGEALLAKKAAFLVFLLADVYAMCTSMVVLFCLIWSMVSEPDMALLLVDRSVYILMQSLYSTLLSFMAGIYTVISHSSLWAAILIFVMCSLVGISANRTILHNVIAKLIPAANTDTQDGLRLLEEGSAGAGAGAGAGQNEQQMRVQQTN